MKVDNTVLEAIAAIDEISYVKEMPTTTRVTAVHVKIDNVSYQVVCSMIPRLYVETSAFISTRTGRVKDFTNPIIRFKGDDILEGVKELVATLNGKPTREINKPPLV